jgi:hypothetical protein
MATRFCYRDGVGLRRCNACLAEWTACTCERDDMKQPSEPPMYRVDLALEVVEQLEQGICSETLAQLAHDLLRWRRDAIRATTIPRTYEGKRKEKRKRR